MISAAAQAVNERALAKLEDDEPICDVPAVEFGRTPNARINYLSVSQLKSAAPWVEGGCFRKWWFVKVVGLKEPEKGNQLLGKQVHAQLEHFVETGEDVLGDIARAALPHLPQRGASHVEHSITASNKPITGARLNADGIPLVGFIDRVDYGDEIPRVVDYKTSKNPEKYAATEADLATTATGAGIQMVGYVVAETPEFPEAQIFEVEHLYLHTKATKVDKAEGRDAKPVVTTITPADARAEWEARMPALARQLRQVATCKTLDEVEPNWTACDTFGGCHFKPQCLTNEMRRKAIDSPTNGEKPMSLKERLANRSTNPLPVEPKPNPAQMLEEPLPKVVPDDAPPSDPKLAAEPLPTEKPAESEKPKRKKKSVEVPLTEQQGKEIGEMLNASEPPKSVTIEPAKPDAADQLIADTQKILDEGKPTLSLYVDCIPNKSAEPLAGYIAEKVEGITKVFPDLIELRCAPNKNAEGKDHMLAFGKWKGVLAAECKLAPPAPGRYFALGVAQSEIAQVVVEALEPLCSEFVKGVR